MSLGEVPTTAEADVKFFLADVLLAVMGLLVVVGLLIVFGVQPWAGP